MIDDRRRLPAYILYLMPYPNTTNSSRPQTAPDFHDALAKTIQCRVVGRCELGADCKSSPEDILGLVRPRGRLPLVRCLEAA